ncbi:MAG: amino acid permease [Candidatus Uhrbacteria bacterium]|nr:amino acid permease [Candidatus Uhrbacteria bacterium]
MIHPDFKFLRAVFMMIGGIVGVGVFGLPFAFAQSGFSIGLLELLVIGIVLLMVQFMYAELALQTEGTHRLVGYVEIYLGKKWSWLSTAAICASVWGAMLAYMIIGGKFLFLLLSPVFGGTAAPYSYIVGIIAAALIYRGLQFASKLEVFVILALLFLFIFMIALSVPHIEIGNLAVIDPSKWFLPYGIILFALSSTGIVPEMRDVLGMRAKKQLGKAMLIGMTIVVLLYAFFSFAVVGVTGVATTGVAFDGLISVFGTSFRVIASVLGLITILSIYMLLGITLQNTFKFDLRCSKLVAFALTVGVPFLFFAFGVREFVDLVGFIGSVFGGMLGIFIVLCYLKLKQEPVCREHHCLNLPDVFSWLAILFFLGGLIFTLYRFLV